MGLETYITEVIEGRRPSFFVKGTLSLLSRLYRLGVRGRHFAYDKGLFKTHGVPKMVVSVGNIVVGGTGKTPVVHKLVEALKPKFPVAVLSRGFRSQAEKADEVLCASHGSGPLLAPHVCGDEPYFLAEKLRVPVWVGKDRLACAQEAVAFGAECLILDDGMQHRRLKRDLEIVVVDANDPFGKGIFLPRGFLREMPERLCEADLIVVNHVEDEQHYKEVQRLLAPYTHAPFVGMQLEVVNQELCSNRSVGIFCGIGKPLYFVETVQALGNDIVNTLFLLDHVAPKEKQLQVFAEECRERGAEVLLCTEKDWVKLPLHSPSCLPIVPVRVQLNIAFGQAHWDAMIEKIETRVGELSYG